MRPHPRAGNPRFESTLRDREKSPFGLTSLGISPAAMRPVAVMAGLTALLGVAGLTHRAVLFSMAEKRRGAVLRPHC
jgi:hypothetical protein